MGFWTVPLLHANTQSAVDIRMEFVLAVVAAWAASGESANGIGAVLAAAGVADPSDYGDTSAVNRAMAFLSDYRDAQTARARYRTADKAASSVGGQDMRAGGGS